MSIDQFAVTFSAKSGHRRWFASLRRSAETELGAKGAVGAFNDDTIVAALKTFLRNNAVEFVIGVFTDQVAVSFFSCLDYNVECMKAMMPFRGMELRKVVHTGLAGAFCNSAPVSVAGVGRPIAFCKSKRKRKRHEISAEPPKKLGEPPKKRAKIKAVKLSQVVELSEVLKHRRVLLRKPLSSAPQDWVVIRSSQECAQEFKGPIMLVLNWFLIPAKLRELLDRLHKHDDRVCIVTTQSLDLDEKWIRL